MLVYAYVFALVLGGALLAASILFGGEQSADGDADLDGEHGHQDVHSPDMSHGLASPLGFFATLSSLRFWTFFAAFFGATGLVLDGLDLVDGPIVPLLLAVAMGAFTGWMTVTVIRVLSNSSDATVATAADYVGKTGRVLLPIDRERIGKVRLRIAGTTVDVLARSEEEHPFSTGEEAMVIQMDGTTAVVARADTPLV